MKLDTNMKAVLDPSNKTPVREWRKGVKIYDWNFVLELKEGEDFMIEWKCAQSLRAWCSRRGISISITDADFGRAKVEIIYNAKGK